MHVNIIGAGRVGQTLGYLMVEHQLAAIGGVLNRTVESTQTAIKAIGAGVVCETLGALPAADLTLITTPDEYIEQTCLDLCRTQVLRPHDIVIHCSGVLSSSILASARDQGAYIASVHPMQSMASVKLAALNFKGVYCAIEGDLAALNKLELLFSAMGAITYLLDSEKKALYHAAAVFSSNYLITLAEISLTCLAKAGVDRVKAKAIVIQLMQQSIANLDKLPTTTAALTGPIQRADIKTIQQHLAALSEPLHDNLYKLLGLATLPLSIISEDKAAELLKIFSAYDL